MVLEDIADLFEQESKKKTATQLARVFDKERKWVYGVKNGCNVVLNPEFIGGLSALGYEIVLQKKTDRRCKGWHRARYLVNS